MKTEVLIATIEVTANVLRKPRSCALFYSPVSLRIGFWLDHFPYVKGVNNVLFRLSNRMYRSLRLNQIQFATVKPAQGLINETRNS